MVSGQSYTDGMCLKCGKTLPPLVDNQGWGTVDCVCGEYYTTDKYEDAGGVFHKATCPCESCARREEITRRK